MKAIVNTGPGRLEMLDLPTPEPGPGQVRIRTGACGICATDIEMIEGWERTGFPSIPGHEWSGTVDAVGLGGDSSIVGRRCVGENILLGGGEVGFEHPGGYAEYFITEARNLQFLPKTFPFMTAALIEPLAVCVRGVRRLRGDTGDPVLVFGDGPIGLIVTRLLASLGKRVTLVGGRQSRLKLAWDLGASRTVNYHEGWIEGQKFATIVEASGSTQAVEASLDLSAPSARILLIGDYGSDRASFPWNTILHREIELIGSNASADAWPEAVRLAVDEKFPLNRLITHRVTANEFQVGVDLMRTRREGVIKVVIEWN